MSLFSLLGIDPGDFIDAWLKGKSEQHAYLAPIAKPLGDGSSPRNRMVRLDHAIMALHLASASISVRSFAGQIRQLAGKVQGKLDNWIIDKALKVEGGLDAAATRPLAAARAISTLLDLSTFEIEKEANIRRKMWKARDDLFRNALPQRVRRRGRKRVPVSSRHWSRPQRKANS